MNLSISGNGINSSNPLILRCYTCHTVLKQCDRGGRDCNHAVPVSLPSEPTTNLGKFVLFKCISKKCTDSLTHKKYPHKNRLILCRCAKCLRLSKGRGGIVRKFEDRGNHFQGGHYQYGGDDIAESDNPEALSISIANLRPKRSVLVTFEIVHCIL